MTAAGVSASILAGGKSTRFGSDKALFAYRGKALIELVIDVLKNIFSEIVIIADVESRFSHLGYPVFSDLYPDIGPICGIYTALYHSKTEHVFVVASDMPFLSGDLVRYMISCSDGYDVIVPCIRGYYEPLHAIYSKNCLNPVLDRIKNNDRMIFSFYNEVRVRKIGEDEVGRFAHGNDIFKNINSRHDAL